jgi:hypothetical protein
VSSAQDRLVTKLEVVWYQLKSSLVIYPLSFVKSLVFVGIFRLSILSYTAFLLGAISVAQSQALLYSASLTA